MSNLGSNDTSHLLIYMELFQSKRHSGMMFWLVLIEIRRGTTKLMMWIWVKRLIFYQEPWIFTTLSTLKAWDFQERWFQWFGHVNFSPNDIPCNLCNFARLNLNQSTDSTVEVGNTKLSNQNINVYKWYILNAWKKILFPTVFCSVAHLPTTKATTAPLASFKT